MIINTNLMSINAQRNLMISDNAVSKSLEKLSSGYRINRAADDAAGLAISERMKAQIRGFNQAQRNSQDGISLMQTADGSLDESQSILQRLRELGIQAANDTNTTTDRASLQLEVNALVSEIDRIATTTNFNTQKLLDGSFTAKVFQVGANTGEVINLGIASFGSGGLGVAIANMQVTSVVACNTAISAANAALTTVSTTRASFGAIQNRLEHTITNLALSSENLSAANSRIRDVDMAAEMSIFTRNQILTQSGVAMLAQANQAPQSILKLLG